MARVLMPVMSRRYNHNPRGSSTATVTMKSNNPFEARVQLAGMGDITPAPATSPVSAAPATQGFNWQALAQGIAQAGVQVGGALATNAINQRYGQLPAPGAVPLPTQTSVRYAPAPSSWLPIAIIGGAVVLGGGILLMMRGGKKRR